MRATPDESEYVWSEKHLDVVETARGEYTAEKMAEGIASEDTEASGWWSGEAGMVLVEGECVERGGLRMGKHCCCCCWERWIRVWEWNWWRRRRWWKVAIWNSNSSREIVFSVSIGFLTNCLEMHMMWWPYCLWTIAIHTFDSSFSHLTQHFYYPQFNN
jgi:hypothetical protein